MSELTLRSTLGVMGELGGEIGLILDATDVAEDEIAAAQRRHGEPLPVRSNAGKVVSYTGPLWNSFRLLVPTHHLMERTEFVFRAHCRELLERVASGEDTRPGTGAEMCLALMEISKVGPLRGCAVGLYLRLFERCFPQQTPELWEEWELSLADYERMHGRQMDEYEELLRKKLRQHWRK